MAELLRMPEVAANATSAVLSSWAVADGVDYAMRETIAVIETDKAIVDLEADSAGRMLRALVAAGAEVAVGAPIALIGAPGEVVGDIDELLRTLGAGGESPSSDASAAPTPMAGAPAAEPTAPPAASRRFSSPLARRLAREAGLELASITGTGRDGSIVRRDVLAAIAQAAQGNEAATGTGASSAPRAAQDDSRRPMADDHIDIPHTRIRRAIASRLIESKTTAPHFYVRGTAQVDALLALRKQVNGGTHQVSVNDLIVKAVARAHTLVPAMNAIWTADAVRRFSTVDIAVAVNTDNGLVTPIVRDVDRRTLTDVSRDIRDLAERARSGKLQQHELEGGSVTVSNLGMYGTEEFAAIINPPQASILAVGAIRRTPIVREDDIVIANVVTVTLSVDHRPVDGVAAAEWMRAFLALLEAPAQILA